MKRKLAGVIGLRVLAPAAVLSLVLHAQPRKDDTRYPGMAPVDQYLIADKNAEVALARSAAPKAISDKADVMVLEP